MEVGSPGKLFPQYTKCKKVPYLSNGCTSEGQKDCKNCKSLNEISGSSLSNLRGFRVCKEDINSHNAVKYQITKEGLKRA